MLSIAQAPKGLSRIPWIGAEVALLRVHLRGIIQKAMLMCAWSLKTRHIRWHIGAVPIIYLNAS